MKKSLPYIFLLILLAMQVSAVVDLTLTDLECVKPAGATLKVKNVGGDTISTHKLSVTATFFSPFSIGQDDRGVDSNYLIPVNGSFSTDEIRGQATSTFISNSDIFTYPGKYKLTLKYENCKKSYRKCEAYGELTCPGIHPYGCEAIPLQIDSCENRGNELQLLYHNVRKGLMTAVDPYKDIEYTFYGTTRHIENELPKGTIIDEVGIDTFLLRFSTNNNTITRVKVNSAVCAVVDFANCKSVPLDNISADIPDKAYIHSAENGTNFTTSYSEKSYGAIYIISLIVVAILVGVIYKIKKVEV